MKYGDIAKYYPGLKELIHNKQSLDRKKDLDSTIVDIMLPKNPAQARGIVLK